MSRRSRITFLTLVLVAGFGLSAAPAAATINGPCEGSGVFDPGPTVDARTAEKIEIPLSATVSYAGGLPGIEAGTERPIGGEVRVALPFTQITVGTWEDADATGVADSGTYDYDVPSVLAGFDITVSGEHSENGALVCSGSVTLRLEGGNPLALPAVGFTVIGLLGVSLSIRTRPDRQGGVSYEF